MLKFLSLNDCPGILCGVQTGLQSGMDLLKFLLVIALPHQNTFGILILTSFMVSIACDVGTRINN